MIVIEAVSDPCAQSPSCEGGKIAKSSASGVGINEYVLQPDGTSTTEVVSVAEMVGVSVGAGLFAVAVGLGGVVGVAVAGGGVALPAQALRKTVSAANPITRNSVRFCMVISWFTISSHFTSVRAPIL